MRKIHRRSVRRVSVISSSATCSRRNAWKRRRFTTNSLKVRTLGDACVINLQLDVVISGQFVLMKSENTNESEGNIIEYVGEEFIDEDTNDATWDENINHQEDVSQDDEVEDEDKVQIEETLEIGEFDFQFKL